MRPGAEAASPGSATVGISRQAPSGARDGDEKVPAGAITSPMVGTAYLGPEPGAAPFVQVGDTIEEGQILIIIEAMKVMNPIPSPRAGNVLRILVSDGQPVEYGEPLMVIE
jgi:acetyl-CoA carboxylase biotin carboxyl carrier protein